MNSINWSQEILKWSFSITLSGSLLCTLIIVIKTTIDLLSDKDYEEETTIHAPPRPPYLLI